MKKLITQRADMSRPSFQFYPADWRNNAKLRRCSEAARGAWIDILCLLHDMDEYGVCRWPLADLARASNISNKLIKELVDKGVLKGADHNAEPYIFTPRHAGKDGEPVVLVENNSGPVWYCSRFVRDEYIRQRRGQSTRFNEANQPQKNKPKPQPNNTPKPTIGDDFGYGPSSSSSSSLKPTELTHSSETNTSNAVTEAASVCLAIKQQGIADVNPSHPTLLALLQAGATKDEFSSAAASAMKKGKPQFSYTLGIVKRQREEAATLVLHQGAMPSKATNQSIHDKRSATAKAMFGETNEPRIIDVSSSDSAASDRPAISAHG